jgi:hypothetical protein
MTRMRTFLSISSLIVFSGCAGGGYEAPVAVAAPPPERQGPQIVNHETVDWTPLNPVVSIRLENLHYTSDTLETSDHETSTEKLELQFFPRQKYITFEVVPVGNASLSCIEQGNIFDLFLVASPGADVSDQVTCVGQNFTRYQLSLSYMSSAKFAAHALTIDGNARIRGDSFDDNGHVAERSDYTIDVRGSVQITGGQCRVISWRQAWSETFFSQGPNDPDPLREQNQLEAASDTTCAVVTGK